MEEHDKEAMLTELLADAFESNTARLRQWVRHSVGRQAYRELPGDSASLYELAFQAVLIIKRHTSDNKRLFESLRDALPGMAERIRDVAEQWGVAFTGPLVKSPEPPTGPDSRNYGVVAAILMLGVLLGISDVPNVSAPMPSESLVTLCKVKGDMAACESLAELEQFVSVAAAYEQKLRRSLDGFLRSKRRESELPQCYRGEWGSECRYVLDRCVWRGWSSPECRYILYRCASGEWHSRECRYVLYLCESGEWHWGEATSTCRYILERFYGAQPEIDGGVEMD